MLSKSHKQFWSEIQRINSEQNNPTLAENIGGVSGAKDIAEMWKHHFAALLNTNERASMVFDKNEHFERLAINEIKCGIENLKKSKS